MRHGRAGLVGRETELTALRHLDAGTLVTVVGPGGVGKTRLALAAADEVQLPEAAVCELAGVTDPAQVAGAVGEALGFPSWPVALVGLAETERLLVLDNCEHVLDAAAEVAERLLQDCPRMTILATSREPLEVPGEDVLQLQPLALPATDDPAGIETSPAVQLFLARASAAGVSGLLAAGTAAADVARLCRRLDGLPLAIELAAARTPSLTPAEILGHLDHRLDVIARRRQRGLARHRSLEAAIGWSYDRLSATMQQFFERLGVFAGPFSAAAARAVAAEPTEDLLGVVGDLDHLVAQSLIAARQQSDQTWYVLLDTVRAFARTRLAERGQLDAARERWVDWLVELAVDAVERLFRTGSQDAWRTLHTLERDMRAALGWCLDHDLAPDRAVQLFPALFVLLYGADAEPWPSWAIAWSPAGPSRDRRSGPRPWRPPPPPTWPSVRSTRVRPWPSGRLAPPAPRWPRCWRGVPCSWPLRAGATTTRPWAGSRTRSHPGTSWRRAGHADRARDPPRRPARRPRPGR
jgi:predicted ATPase